MPFKRPLNTPCKPGIVFFWCVCVCGLGSILILRSFRARWVEGTKKQFLAVVERDMKDASYASFSSAGTRGFCFHGMMTALEGGAWSFDEWRDGLQGIAGTSAGAIAALSVVLRLTTEKRERVLLRNEMNHFNALFRAPDLVGVPHKFGLDDGDGLRMAIGLLLETGGLAITSTLDDLKRLTRTELVCVTCNLVTRKPYYLRADTHPTMLVVDAVYASCALPMLYQPLHLDENTVLIDAFAVEAQPLCYPVDKTLFLRVETQHRESYPIRTFWEYAHSLFDVVLLTPVQTPPAQTILCRTTAPLLDFDMPIEQKRALMDAGYAHGWDFVHSFRLSERITRATEVVIRTWSRARTARANASETRGSTIVEE